VIAGKRILLVEDVITTGATIAAAAYQLRQAGATHVDVIALARTRVWKRFRARVHTIFTPTKRMT
jgi:orotate phosphoribosyltransferase